MRRPGLIAALLLPLPFAALPLLALLFTGGGASGPETNLVREAPAVVITDSLVTSSDGTEQSAPLSYSSPEGDCGRHEGNLGGDL